MRITKIFNDSWQFSKNGVDFEAVTLPHTWNGVDGQDGGNDYYRGTCYYKKNFKNPLTMNSGALDTEGLNNMELWLEFRGAAMSARVEMNGQLLGQHAGGYSTFRVNLTEALRDENELCVSVDNGKNSTVYPQKADFTFYGGIYRDVWLIMVPKNHFALGDHGSPGIKVTPMLSEDGSRAKLRLEAWCVGAANTVEFSVAGLGAETSKTITAAVSDGYACATLQLEQPHLWDGIDDPYLYCARAALGNDDAVEVHFGIRRFSIDPEKGFFLNGRSYPLCGVSRHQDRPGIGYTLTKADHDEDMAIIRELGANTVRLAHYQHDQYFYDLCDRYGLIVWAEIPYITQHMPKARENTLSQMTELIAQNHHHPSIICWGLSNEITAAGGVQPDTVENHRLLNDLCHEMDETRLTTMAHAFMLDENDPFVMASDIRSYNLYYGWYLGELDDNDRWFDEFHEKYPDRVIGLSEYGADANPAYQSAHPEQGDWTESYQALYHEHMLKMWETRPYIWAMHVWNLFDFGADGRDEGGKPGQNQKGLVTFDRKLRKDAFYLYKAYLSREPFIHLCGSRYVDRTEAETEIKVYTNQKEVTLFVDHVLVEKQTGERIFRFQIPISGEHTITATAGTLTDTMVIRKVETPNLSYMAEGRDVVNWFDTPEELRKDGYYSILDTMADIKRSPEGAALVAKVIETARKSYGEVAQSAKMPESVVRLQDRATFQSLLKKAGKAVLPDMVREINDALNRIRRV